MMTAPYHSQPAATLKRIDSSSLQNRDPGASNGAHRPDVFLGATLSGRLVWFLRLKVAWWPIPRG